MAHSKTLATCHICGEAKTIIKSTLRKNIKKNGYYLCKTCYLKSDSARQKTSKAMKALWASDEYRARQSESIRRVDRSETSRRTWERHRDKIMAGLEANKLSKESKSKISKRLWSRPGFRKKVSESMRKRWADKRAREKWTRIRRTAPGI